MRRIAVLGLPERDHFRRVLGHLRDLDYDVVSVGRGSQSVFEGVCERRLIVPRLDFENVLAVLQSEHQRSRIDGIALFHEMAVEVSTRVAAALGLPHFCLDLISSCASKVDMRQAMARTGVPCPRFLPVTGIEHAYRAADEFGFPLVIKPTRGGASFGVTRLDDRGDLERFFGRIEMFWAPREFVIEEYMDGHEVSVETITDRRGNWTHLAVFDKPQALTGPFFLEELFVIGGGLRDDEIRDAKAAATELVEKLGLTGCITHTEIRLTSRGPRVIEFGLRPIGWPGPLCVQAATGVDLIAAMAAFACGDDFDAAPVGLGTAGWRYLTIPRPGRVQSVPDVNEMESMPGYLDASTWVDVGEVVDVPPSDFNYIRGHLAIGAPDSRQMIAALSDRRWDIEVAD